jgi:hypothetical protein
MASSQMAFPHFTYVASWTQFKNIRPGAKATIRGIRAFGSGKDLSSRKGTLYLSNSFSSANHLRNLRGEEGFAFSRESSAAIFKVKTGL